MGESSAGLLLAAEFTAIFALTLPPLLATIPRRRARRTAVSRIALSVENSGMPGRVSRIYALFVVGAVLCLASGCLSLGGTTNHVHDDPDLKARVSSLESRVGTLEAALQTGVHSSPSDLQ